MPVRAEKPQIPSASFDQIRHLDTCLVSNAIERLNGRLRNEGTLWGRKVKCLFPDFAPVLGYAATARVHTSFSPIRGRCYHENMNWWRYVASLPEPRIMVLQDADDHPGAGALVGELHAAIGLALNCAGCVTNGSVRDLPAVQSMGFHLFAGSVAVSHQYAHVAEFGIPVEIGGWTISNGELVHGDRHGVHTIPFDVAESIPKMADEIRREEHELVEYCRSNRFSLRGLDQKLQASPADRCSVRVG